MTREDRKKQAEELDRQAWEKWKNLLSQEGEYLDEGGYPTELACDIIKHWHWSDQEGWFEFIKNIWHLASWGWHEEYGGYDDYLKEPLKEDKKRYYISTAGWSGNETLIGAMKENPMLWHLTWVQSRRGGHYIFELYGIREDL